MTLPDTIGGHSREVLTEALRQLVALEKLEKYHLRGWPDDKPFPYPEQRLRLAVHDVVEPAKLAELMASALRERGWHACDLSCTADETASEFCGATIGFEISAGIDSLCIAFDGYVRPEARHVSIPQARAALLRILELPERATAADAIKALEVGK